MKFCALVNLNENEELKLTKEKEVELSKEAKALVEEEDST
jgi:hypothetical protein